MKKHLVLICGYHYPNPSSTAICAQRYVSLLDDEFDIDIISCTEDGNAYSLTSPEGYNLHVLSCPRLRAERKALGFIKHIIHGIGSFLLLTSYLGNQKWFAKAVTRELYLLHREHPIDVIFSVCSPLSAHVAAANFKKKMSDVKLVGYTVDPYSTTDRIKPIGKSIEDLARYEQNVLKAFDHILLSEEVFDNRTDLRYANPHCTALPYQLPAFPNYEDITQMFKKDSIHCVYAGSFYDDIRNPEYLLKLFSRLKEDNIVLHLFSKGCENIVNKYADDAVIVSHGMVPMSQLNNVYESADILIGIGNALKEFLPSKTFEYISILKPIIYINYPNIDNPVLYNYPAALQIDMASDIDVSVALLKSFCETTNTLVDKSEILKTYAKYSPTNIKEILIKAIDS